MTAENSASMYELATEAGRFGLEIADVAGNVDDVAVRIRRGVRADRRGLGGAGRRGRGRPRLRGGREVKALAEETRSATAEIEATLQSLNAQAEATIGQLDESMACADSAGGSARAIATVVDEVRSAIGNIDGHANRITAPAGTPGRSACRPTAATWATVGSC